MRSKPSLRCGMKSRHSLADTALRPRRQLATPPVAGSEWHGGASCGIRKPRPRADGGQAPAGWPSAVMFRACVAEQSAVALDAESKIGMRMAISYSAVQPRVLAKSGKARGRALSHRTCRRVIRRISQPYIRIRIPNRRSDSPDRPAAYSCSDDTITCRH